MADAPPSGPTARCASAAQVQAELQALGAMLAPVVFRAPGRPDFAPMQVAPWAAEAEAEEQTEPAAQGGAALGPDRGAVASALPGILRRLRGDWPCVPFGTTTRPPALGTAWAPRDPGDAHGHGWGANHAWQWLDDAEAARAADAAAADAGTAALEGPTLGLVIDYPASSPVRRLTRLLRLSATAPRLQQWLRIEVREACRLPVALHPTFRLDAGAVALRLPGHGGVLSYPVPPEPGRSRLQPDARFADLAAAPLQGGGQVDLGRFPLPFDTEELLQIQGLAGALQLDYLDLGWRLTLDWDRALLPDAMLWISHRGRLYPPWNGRHLALGLEPLNAAFDLARVAAAPAGHPLAVRQGLALAPGRGRVIASALQAEPLR